MTDVWTWPIGSIVPARQTFYAPGQAVSGGLTAGGVPSVTREPGGWATLDYEFSALGGAYGPRLVSWLLSAVRNWRPFTIPIVISPQLVPATEFGVAASLEWQGLPWDNDQPWSNGENWTFSPVAKVATMALKGSTTLIVDMAILGDILRHGHVIGVGQNAYLVDDLDTSGTSAVVTVSPPLRRSAFVGDLVRFRPWMTGVCTTPETFETLFDPGGLVRPGSIRFTEVDV